ncbi:MAG: 4'-phosphopantetheinyl transferase superfamily protein [Thermodesulfobacteriota bacterium]|nr:4'-phosphopantetheinyl transferase superfamily protein [Thermodesulfobacteriota bacterium]
MYSEITIWQSSPHNLTFRAGELHLWRFNLDCSAEKNQNQETILSVDELAKAERLLDLQKQEEFILVRSHLRRLLGDYLRLDPDLLRFRYNESGKPFLDEEHNSALSFNLSHSGSWAIIAVTSGIDVGIDSERIDPELNFQQLANHFFDLTEKNRLEKYSRIRQRRGFYRLWTEKEAILKMEGSGFRGLKSEEQLSALPKHSYLKKVFLAPDYVSTVATNREITAIIKFNSSV